jgi:hypothetical protein
MQTSPVSPLPYNYFILQQQIFLKVQKKNEEMEDAEVATEKLESL